MTRHGTARTCPHTLDSILLRVKLAVNMQTNFAHFEPLAKRRRKRRSAQHNWPKVIVLTIGTATSGVYLSNVSVYCQHYLHLGLAVHFAPSASRKKLLSPVRAAENYILFDQLLRAMGGCSTKPTNSSRYAVPEEVDSSSGQLAAASGSANRWSQNVGNPVLCMTQYVQMDTSVDASCFTRRFSQFAGPCLRRSDPGR